MPQRTRVDSFSRVDTRHDVMGDVTTHYVLIRLPRPTLFDPFILTRFESPKKKKKKEKGLTKLNFEFDQKVKISKMGLSHSVFRVHSNFGIRFFIRDSEIVQMAQFLKSWLLHESWPKVKIFKTDLSHLVFRVHFDFGIRFFIQESEIVQTVQFPESLFLHKS